MAIQSVSHSPADVPLAVWPVAQTSDAHNRQDAPPQAIPPALAARIVSTFSTPEALVVAPFCEEGTVLVEAGRLGRKPIGVDVERRHGAAARRSLDRADAHRSDARARPDALRQLVGRVDLVVLAPPRPASSASRARSEKFAAAMTDAFADGYRMLRPGGLLVTVTRSPRLPDRCVDLAGTSVQLARSVGFAYIQHIVALLSPLRDSRMCGSPSSAELRRVRRARSTGTPAHAVVHEDVCVFMKAEAGR